MTPKIALDLSPEAITLLSRGTGDVWYREGVVRLDAPDLNEALNRLRDMAETRVGPTFTSILILPDSQLLFTSLDRDDRDPKVTIKSLLRGRTPYDVEDLVFDYVQRGDRLQVVVAARETLDEAEAFAADHGFRPVALIAAPTDTAYPGLPSFGPTSGAGDLLDGAKLDLGLGRRIVVQPAPPLPEPAPKAVVQPDADTDTDTDTDDTESAKTDQPSPDDGADSDARAETDGAAFARFVATPPPAAPQRARPDGLAPIRPKAPPPSAPAPKITPPKSVPASGAATIPFPAPQPKGEIPVVVAEDAASYAPLPDLSTVPDDAPSRDDPKDEAPEVQPPPPTGGDGPPVFNHAPTPKAPSSGTPAAASFSSRRRPVGRATPPLSRITPKMVADAVDEVPDPEDGDVPPLPAVVTARNAKAVADKVRPKGGAIRAIPSATQTADSADDTGRSGTDPAPKAATGQHRLGLYLTLGLLVILGLIGVWASAFLPEAERVEGTAPTSQAEVAPAAAVATTDALRPVERDEEAVRAADATDRPVPDEPPAPTEEDIALLLPESRLHAGATTASPIPDLVTPPLPIAGATPEELAEGLDEDAVVVAEPDAGPTEGEAEVFEVAGIFTAPYGLGLPDVGGDEVTFVAGIDPVIESGDAVALPRTAAPQDSFSPQTSPAPAGTAFVLADDGLVAATPDGTLAPGGYLVVAGAPEVPALPRPTDTASQQTAQAAEDDAQRVELARVRPEPRPDDAAEQVERTRFNGLTEAELTQVRPVRRPQSIVAEAAARAESEQIAAAAAAATAAAENARAEEQAAAAVRAAAAAASASLANRPASIATPSAPTAETTGAPTSPLALAQSNRPLARPRNVEREAAQIITQRRAQTTAAAASTASTTPPPAASSAPSSDQRIRDAGGSVARAATQENAIRLRQVNLIGVFGQPSARRALVRLANGRYVRVKVGDQLDRGRVTAIGDGQLSYQKRGRNIVLRIPNV